MFDEQPLVSELDLKMRIVPWVDWKEWNHVYQHLYGSISDARLALEIITVWRARGNIPHSVEGSAGLIQVAMQDSVVDDGSMQGNLSEMELRMLYSLAIIRSINGLVDPSQKGIYVESVLSIASNLGIPAWIVEIRHDGTHNSLSSIGVLRAACTYLLQWYRDNYWNVQFQRVQGSLNAQDDSIVDTETNSLSVGSSIGSISLYTAKRLK